jgi:hypothetical protein
MFERAQNPPKKLPIAPPYKASELDRTPEKTNKLDRKLFIRLGAIGLTLSTLSATYWTDVQVNRAEQAAAEITINVIAESPDEDNDKASIFIDGFNAYDADYLAKSLGPVAAPIAEGEQWSLSYNNALLSRESIYESIAELAEERGIEHISIEGYSMGGIIGAEAACDLVKNTSLNVDLLNMMHTPYGSEGLQPYQKKELGFGKALATGFPGSIDSSFYRFGGELYFYRDNYFKGEFEETFTLPSIQHNASIITDNVKSFANTFGNVVERFDNPKRTSMQLLSEQVYKIDQFNMLDELQCIADQRDEKQMPVITYGSMVNDFMVINSLSRMKTAHDAKETGLNFHSYFVEDAVHSQYNKTIDEYKTAFERASVPVNASIQAEAARRAFQLFAQEPQKTYPTEIEKLFAVAD